MGESVRGIVHPPQILHDSCYVLHTDPIEAELNPELAPQLFPIRHGSILAFVESGRLKPGQLVEHDASNAIAKTGSKASLRFYIPELTSAAPNLT